MPKGYVVYVQFRELRDIIKSLKPIVDVLLLLLFIVFVFALLGKWDRNLTSFALCHQTIMFTYLHIGYYIFAEVDPSVSKIL